MSVTGSILRNFSTLELSTADEKTYTLHNNLVSRIALRIIGLPHLGFRMRARIILAEALQVSNDARILDAGCGYGLYSLTLASHKYTNISSIDLDQKRIDGVNKMLSEVPEFSSKITATQGSVTSLPFENNYFDMIICSEVIEHVPQDTLAIKELSRVLKPGGKLILSVPMDSTTNKKVYRRFLHERPGYTRAGLQNMFALHGVTLLRNYYYEYTPLGTWLFDTFNKINSKPLLGIFFYPFYLLYIIDRFLKLGEPNYIVIVATK